MGSVVLFSNVKFMYSNGIKSLTLHIFKYHPSKTIALLKNKDGYYRAGYKNAYCSSIYKTVVCFTSDPIQPDIYNITN